MENRWNKIIAVIVLIVGFFVTLWLLSGCATARVSVDHSVLEHQARIAELENRVRDYEERLRQYDSLISGTVERLEATRGRADRITDRIERLIYLFEEYERELQRILSTYNPLGTNYQETTSYYNSRNIIGSLSAHQ